MTQTLDDLDWLVGRWISDTKAGRSQTLWTQPDGGLMIGVNLEVKSESSDGPSRSQTRVVSPGEASEAASPGFSDPSYRRVVYEFLRVEESTEGLTLFSSTNGEREISFALRELESRRVEFQRQFPDFPSLVAYWQDGDDLFAKIEGIHHGRRHTMEWRWNRH